MTEDDLKQARILIVDDEVSNICLLQSVLNRTGFLNHTSISDSRQALQRILDWQPDLLLLDLNMPHLSGFDVMQWMRVALPPDNYLPVLVLTADQNPETKRRSLAAGATDFLPKPFDMTEALMRIRNLLNTRLLHLELQKHNALLEQRVSARTADLSRALAELKQTQQQIVQQERLRAFGEMAGGIVHDFNNALMSIIGYSDLLIHDPATLDDRETTLDYLKTLNTAGRDAAHVVSRLRDFYRGREIEDVFAPLDLNEVIEESASLTQPKWKTQALASGRTISVEFDLEKLPLISGNPSELREVMTNLIFNAVDAMPEGGTITLRSRRDEDDVLFEIADTGSGMSEAVRNRCLEPFFSTKGDKGTGLGLSMVFGIIKRHNGTLDIESTLGRGTTFRIRLPAAETSDGTIEDTAKLDRSIRVLVVDDDTVPRDVVAKYLVADGHHVSTATSGGEAMTKLTEGNFDLLLTDQTMAGMTGLQLAAAVKQLGGGQPVILMTGSSETASIVDQHADVSVVLRKPIPQQRLRQALHQILNTGAAEASRRPG
ncbi:MAG TPA: response regulator [Chthoniobacterales bacterium]|nr:response regulator [Chthoniobacterales bacterium]